MQNTDKILVFIITFTAAYTTWKLVFDFYKQRFISMFAHIIAILTATFMFIASMILFIPTNYVRNVSPEVEITATSVLSIFGMLAIIYFFFRYLPSRK